MSKTISFCGEEYEIACSPVESQYKAAVLHEG